MIATEWQRQGTFNLIREGFRSHSEYERRGMVSWPNAKNQGRQKKHGRGFRVIGPLPQARWNLRRGLLDRLTPQRRPETVVIDRFDSTFDTLTWRWMGSDGFWSPHDSEFLNWRYLRHPVREYGAFAVLGPKGDAIGYCVVGLDGDEAHLVEMTAPFEATAYRALLNRASRMAQEAGARRMRFFATPSWPGWPLLRELGFLDRPSDRCLMVRSVEVGGPDHFDLDAWQLLPGDDDTI